MRASRLFAFACALICAVARGPAAADDYPNRPITLIVPYAAGGGNDLMARLVADKMSTALGQPIVIENRGGAGGSIATRQVAHAAADGYTLGLGGTGTLAVDPTLYTNVGYDPRRDFAPVGLIATSALVVLVNPQVPAKTIPELVALAKSEPGKLTFASAGVGSAPALTDLIGGHVSIYFSSLPPAIGLVKDGKVRALAVTGPERSKIFPDLPTVAEAGLPGYAAVLHYGIVAPTGTPAAIVARLNGALNAALATADMRQRFALEGAEPLPSTPEEYAADIDREEAKWAKVVKTSGAKVD